MQSRQRKHAASRAKGLGLEEALQAYSDPALLAAESSFKTELDRQHNTLFPVPNRTMLMLEVRQAEIRARLLSDFVNQLEAGELVGTAMELPLSPASTREAISPDLWRLLELDFERSEALGPNLELIDILIFDAEERPSATPSASSHEETERPADRIISNNDFSYMRMGDKEFHFAQLQAAAIRELYLASLTADPWRYGKVVLHSIGSSSRSIGDLFRRKDDPSWRLLIEERNSKYRLRHAVDVLPAASRAP
jgi:hypothetical protein